MEKARKSYRPWDPVQNRSEAYVPNEVLPEDDLAFFLIDLVPLMDLGAFTSYYEAETRGAPPYNVSMMCALLVYSYCVGVFSSRRIAAACERNLAFMAIVGKEPPNFRTISDFRKIHRHAFRALFIEVLRLAGRLGMVRLGNVATDGSKIQADASRHKAMSYAYMLKEIERLEKEIDELMAKADQVDAEQDAELGSRRGDELPEELKRRKERLLKIREAKARLEVEAAARAEEEKKRREADAAQREAEGCKRRGREPGPIDSTPEDKAQTNFSDPESKIMKRSNKGFDYCFNAQATVDSENQMIVAAEVTPEANDKQQAVPMAQATLDNLRAAGIERPTDTNGQPLLIPNTADSGYFSEKVIPELKAMGFDPHFATGRQKHHEPEAPVSPDATAPAATEKDKMRQKLATAEGRKLYAARKHIVEPVFGQIKHARGFRQFLLKGLTKVGCEWQLICLTHNLLKIWRHASLEIALALTVRAENAG